MKSGASTFDFSGLAWFWRVADTLLKDEEPDEATWRALFSSPGYRALTYSEFKPEFFQEKWRLAYRPSLAAQREEAVAQGKGRLLKHYREALDKREALREYQARLEREGTLLEQAKELALAYLPAGHYEGYPPVSFVIFDREGRGYTPVVVDLLAAMEPQIPILLFLAHEAHHHWRGHGLNPWGQPGFVPGSKMPPEADLLWVVDQINCEGVADMVDKPPQERAGTPWMRDYQKVVDRAPDYLRRLDRGLRAIGHDPGRLPEVAAALRKALPDSGHPVGYHMARIIEASLGPTRLAETARDPLGFFETYRQAAEGSGMESCLSAEALAALRSVIAARLDS